VFDGARLLRLDAAGRGRPEAVALGDDATDLAASASSLWTLERRRGAAVRRDLRSGRALGRLNGVGRLTPGVERVELVPADGRMLIVRIRRRSVTAIDAGSGRRCTIETGVAPVAIAAGEGRLVVAARDGTLTRAPLDDCGGV
jgi:hypothetical protein